MRTGIIGAGAISEIYLKNLTTGFNNIELVAISDLNLSKAEERANNFNLKYMTVNDLIQNPSIELIINLTPVEVHYEVIKEALLAGKHVYTEKTLTDKSKTAKELIDLANEKGLYLSSAPDTFLGSSFQAARKAIADGLIGDVTSFSISANRNNDLLLSLFPILRTPGNGVLLDYGVYYATALSSILGPTKKVGSIIGRPYTTHKNILPMSPEFGNEIKNPNESQVSAIIQLETGITGTFHIDCDTNTRDESYFSIYGTKGILYLSDANQFGGEIKFLKNIMNPTDDNEAISLWQFTPYSDNDRGIGASDMVDAIRSGRQPKASKEMAYHVLEILESIIAGGEEGKFTEVNSTFEIPEPLNQKLPGITNFSHINFQVKNAKEMVYFYKNVLGMKEQFTLNTKDLGESLKKQYGEDSIKSLLPLMEDDKKIPWIQYFKLSEHQFLEFFYPLDESYKDLPNKDYCGFKMVNYEVSDINIIRDSLISNSIPLKKDVYLSIDGSKKMSVLDPDGNEISFIEYIPNKKNFLNLAPDVRESCSLLNYTTQLSLSVRDDINMVNFYTTGLGLKLAGTLTYGDLANYLSDNNQATKQEIEELMLMRDTPWIDYIEVGPHQFIELIHEVTPKLVQPDRKKSFGYQHFCLEVSDIQSAWDAVLHNGISPFTEIALGIEGAYQFWIKDPDGNELELMQYTKDALQLR